MDFRYLIWFICYFVLETPEGLSADKLAGKRFCGYQHSDDFNREENNTAITEFPWLARLFSVTVLPGKLYGLVYVGTGSLISDRYILTAATCCNNTLNHVRLGEFVSIFGMDCVEETRIEECNDPVENFNVEKTIIHPKYNGVIYENNIALVKLDKIVKYSEYIRPICLPSPDSVAIQTGDILTACGWHEGWHQEEDEKMTVVGEVMSFDECDSMYTKNFTIKLNENNVCIARVNGSIDITCAGETGSPAALSRRRKQWYQEGIVVHFLPRCQESDFPVILMKVSYYYDWIVNSLELEYSLN